MAAPRRFRDVLRDYIPWWLSDRKYSSGKTLGFRYLWAIVAQLDVYMEGALFQGLQARYPGLGTPTALPYIGADRLIQRGPEETDESYAERLTHWLDKHERNGSMEQLATELHEVIPGNPRVGVINRAAQWVICETDGTFTHHSGDWDWDSISNPERANFWSELWVIIWVDPYAYHNWGDGRTWGRDSGIGHEILRNHRAVILDVLNTWHSAHSSIRAVIWTTDAAMFDFNTPATLPDGQWGHWMKTSGGTAVAARNTATCRYWEP